MNRIVRGVVVLAASALAWGCNTEPEELEGGDPTEILVNPGVVFVARGDSQAVLVSVLDQQGTALDEPITVTATGAAGTVNVSVDSLFRPIFDSAGNRIPNPKTAELRLFVRGDALGATTFTVSGGGLTKTVPVTVTPVEIAPTVSSVTPLIGETVTITAEPGLTFGTGSQLVDAAGEPVAYVTSVAPDGSSMTVIFFPGFTGPFTITEVVPSFAPSLTLDLPATTEVTVGSTVFAGLTGVDAIGTAPTITPSATDGGRVGIIDVGTSFPGTFAAADGARFYKLVVSEEGSYVIDVTWVGGKDLGVWVLDETGTEILASDDSGGLDDNQETAHADLLPGTYYIAVGWFDYGPNPLPDYIRIDVTTE